MGVRKTPLPSSPLKHFKVSVKAKQHLIAGTGHESRFLCPKKHLQYRVRTPASISGKTRKRQLMCVHCSISRPITMCSLCSVPLCIPDCYHNYHTSNKEHHVTLRPNPPIFGIFVGAHIFGVHAFLYGSCIVGKREKKIMKFLETLDLRTEASNRKPSRQVL